MGNDESKNDIHADIARAQLILAEKRTSLAVLRTGIAVIALPLSVVTALIAFSRYYNMDRNLPLIIPLMIVCLFLVLFGIYLLARSLRRIYHQEVLLQKLKESDPELRDVLD